MTTSSSDKDRLGRLRELLALEPSKEAFEQIVSLLGQWEEPDTREVRLAYAQAHVESWDPAFREVRVEVAWSDFPNGQPFSCWCLVRSLDFSSNVIGNEGAQAVANSPNIANLTNLYLSNNKLGYEGAQAIANSPHMEKLTTLELDSNDIGDEGAQAIANSPHMAKLTTLDLFYNDIGDEGNKALGFSPFLNPSIRREYLEVLPKVSLAEEAKRRQLPGSSKMTKEALLEALLLPPPL